MSWRRVLDPAVDRWLDDHRPGGARIAPAAAIAAWLLEAARSEGLPPPLALVGVRWLRPLRVPDRGTEVRVTAAGADGSLHLRLLAPRHDRNGGPFGEALIAEASARPASQASGGPSPLGDESRAVELARSFQGPAFRGLRSAARTDGAGLDARVVVSGECPGGLPALPGQGLDARHLDALFQAAARHAGGSLVPARAGSITPGEPNGAACRIRVRRSEDDYILWLGDETGRTRVRVDGYGMQEAGFLGPARPGGVA